MAYCDFRFLVALTLAGGAIAPACIDSVRVGPSGDSPVPGDGSAPEGMGGAAGASGATGATSSSSRLTSAAEEAACAKYLRARNELSERCLGTPAGDFDCTDELFAEDTTRTPENVSACADVIAKWSCEAWKKGWPDCVSPGKRPAGAACISGTQCASLWCSVMGPYPDQCGQCLGVAPPNGACDNTATICGDGQLCCGDADFCVPGRCVDSSSVPSPYVAVGEACDAKHFCQSGRCEATRDGGPTVCVAYPGLGERCDDFCQSGTCDFSCSDGVCAESGRCEPLPKLGEPCVLTKDGSGVACASGARCLDRMCVAVGKTGDPCEPQDAASVQCETGYCKCVGGDCSRYACAEERYPGESCSDPNTFCQEPAKCIDGVCVSGRIGKARADACLGAVRDH